MKLWLDDQWDDPEMPMRHPPKGYTPTKSVVEAARFIRHHRVEAISFDHDLGLPLDGGSLAKYIEKLAFENKAPRIKWDIHSANPVGRGRIERAMESADRFWSKHEAFATQHGLRCDFLMTRGFGAPGSCGSPAVWVFNINSDKGFRCHWHAGSRSFQNKVSVADWIAHQVMRS